MNKLREAEEKDALRRVELALAQTETEVTKFTITGLAKKVKCIKNAFFYVAYNGSSSNVEINVRMEPKAYVPKLEKKDKHDGTYLVVFYPKASKEYTVTIECMEDGKLAEKVDHIVEVERTDRWRIKGLEKNATHQLQTPIPFSIYEVPADDMDVSNVVSTDFYVEVRDPMNRTHTLLPVNCTKIPLEFFMEFTPEYNGIHKLTLYYKSVLIGDVIIVRAGSRRLGGHGARVPVEDFTIGAPTPIGGIQVLPVPTSSASTTGLWKYLGY